MIEKVAASEGKSLADTKNKNNKFHSDKLHRFIRCLGTCRHNINVHIHTHTHARTHTRTHLV